MIRTFASASKPSSIFSRLAITNPLCARLPPTAAAASALSRRSMSSSITDAQASASTLKITSHNQYKTPRLIPSELNPDPLAQFERWLAGALDPAKAGEPEGTPAVHEPEAMVLGTATKEGRPSARVVLLKGASIPIAYCALQHREAAKATLRSNPAAADSISLRPDPR